MSLDYKPFQYGTEIDIELDKNKNKALEELRQELEKSIYEALKIIPQESPEESRARHKKMIKDFLDKVLEAEL